MNAGRTIFAQLMDFVSPYEFRKCVDRYHGHYKVQRFSCWDQFLCLAFAQLTYRESLRDIEACLRVAQPKLYHMGFRGKVARSTLADANEARDWRIYADFAQVLIAIARHSVRQRSPSAWSWSRRSMPWTPPPSTCACRCFRGPRSAGARAPSSCTRCWTCAATFPRVLFITPGSVHDVNILDELAVEAGAFYVMDRGYIDFERLYRLHQAQGLLRHARQAELPLPARDSHPVDKTTGVRSDQTILLYGFDSKRGYPERCGGSGSSMPRSGSGSCS